MAVLFIGASAISVGTAQAKNNDDQTQIILLNDAAAALEDSNPGLSKTLAEFADIKEKEWEGRNVNKDVLPAPVTDKEKPGLQKELLFLKEAALEIKPVYPVIAMGLDKMAQAIDRSLHVEK